ncbi:MAG: hypothetical protein AAGD25_20710 [Cyanobacteria bacterium P01_F01_bin.150]
MTPDEIGIQLHDRSTRGETLTSAEQDQLEEWYALQDAQELYLLQEEEPLSDLSQLRMQVDAALAQLTAISQRIQAVTSENDVLRKEIVVLQQQLVAVQSA